jgi:triacylglycerol lipase
LTGYCLTARSSPSYCSRQLAAGENQGWETIPAQEGDSVKKALLIVPLLLLAAFAGASLTGGDGSSDRREAEAAVINPVVLVHGWNGSTSSMATLKSRFEGQGRQAFSIALPGQNNITNAQALATFINNVKAQTGATQVDLVSHSMGGLSTRYYIKSLGGGGNVAQYVSLGSPHYGTGLACFLTTNAGGQMCPWSSFLSSLNSGDDTPGSMLYTTIYSTNDGLISNSSSRLDGGACFKQVSGPNHSGLTQDAAVFGHVLAAVDGTCPGVFQ